MHRTSSGVTAERFAQGMTFDEYVGQAGAHAQALGALHGRVGGAPASPFFPLWACATIDEILSALHDRLVAGRGPGA